MVKNKLCKLRIALLGSFYLEIDEVEVKGEAWKSKKALTMLKYLAAKHGQKISSDVLIELLWPENEDIDSTRNLHTVVWFVRRVLSPQGDEAAESRLRYSNGSYWLDIDDDACIDINRFEMHMNQAKQLEAEDPEAAFFHYESALQLYRDDFLYDDMYDEWTIHYRDHYKELYFEITVRMANLLRKHYADYKEAVRVCREALHKDPYREELYQTCLKALIQDERYVDAINMYKHYNEILMKEFQLEPSPSTQEIILNMRRYLVKEKVLPVLSVESKEAAGAFNCEKVVFQSVLDIEQRRFERNERHFSMLIIYNENASRLMHQQSQEAFLILQSALRRSDIICQWSLNIIAILLPETKALAAKTIYQRLKLALHSQLNETMSFPYDILSSEYLGDMHEKFQSIVINQDEKLQSVIAN